jgi:hypothetical protein
MMAGLISERRCVFLIEVRVFGELSEGIIVEDLYPLSFPGDMDKEKMLHVKQIEQYDRVREYG